MGRKNVSGVTIQNAQANGKHGERFWDHRKHAANDLFQYHDLSEVLSTRESRSNELDEQFSAEYYCHAREACRFFVVAEGAGKNGDDSDGES